MINSPESLLSRYAPTRCVLCVDPTVVLTDEHIFPDAAGGGISRHILCCQCNSDLGTFVDAPFLNQKNVEMARSAHRLSSRKGHIPQPFSDTHLIQSSNGPVRVRLDSNFVPRVVPSAPSLSVTKAGEIRIELSRDAKDKHEIPKVIRSSLTRFFKTAEGRSLGWTPEQQEAATERSIEGASRLEPTSEPISGPLNGRWHIDLTALFAEHVKVIYEIACLEFGIEFIESAQADLFRAFLRARCDPASPSWDWLESAKSLGVAPFIDEKLKAFLDELTLGESGSMHIALITPTGIVCSMLGTGAVFSVDVAAHTCAIDDARAYVSYIDGSFAGVVRFNQLREFAQARARADGDPDR